MTESVMPNSDEDRLEDLLETRAQIEQAKGILMATYRCGPDEAFELLRRASQGGGVKVHVLAARLINLVRRRHRSPDVGYPQASSRRYRGRTGNA